MVRQKASYLFSAATRLHTTAVWECVVFVLTGLTFIFIGLQMREVVTIIATGLEQFLCDADSAGDDCGPIDLGVPRCLDSQVVVAQASKSGPDSVRCFVALDRVDGDARCCLFSRSHSYKNWNARSIWKNLVSNLSRTCIDC